MLKFYMNRELSSRLNIPLNRWKRWAREFLPPDPLGGLQSGYARQYNLRDAFTVYLAGYLVSGLGYSIPETRQILRDLNGWLQKDVIEPYRVVVESDAGAVGQTPRCDLMIVPTQRAAQPAFSYRVRTLLERQALPREDGAVWQEQFVEKCIKPGAPTETGCYPACARWVDVTAVADLFFKRLSS